MFYSISDDQFHIVGFGIQQISVWYGDLFQVYGTKFYLSAPLTQAVDVKGEWSVTMKGSIIKDYSAYKITTGSETQDLALVFGEGVTDEKYVDFKVSL